MILNAATEEYIKKHLNVKDGKLYKGETLHKSPRQIRIMNRQFLKRRIIEYLETGKWDESNQHKKYITNTSGHVGLRYCRIRKKWLIRFQRKSYLIINDKGYSTKEEAIEAYNKALDEYNNKQSKEGE